MNTTKRPGKGLYVRAMIDHSAKTVYLLGDESITLAHLLYQYYSYGSRVLSIEDYLIIIKHTNGLNIHW